MQSSSWMVSDHPDFPANTSSFWSNGGYRKRKAAESDLEENFQHKIFLTEEKLVKNMQTLSLDLSVNNNTLISQQDEEENESDHLSQGETRFELHKLLKDNLRNADLQDNLINKLCDIERKKLSMQIVPYMPIHPAQLNSHTNTTVEEKEEENQNKTSSSILINEVKKENDDHLFKKPFLPTPYIVEEPSENTTKRTTRMKRSYSQSLRSNNNLSVIELKNDTNDYAINHPQSDYFIFEPTTPVLLEPSTNHSNRPPTQITEYFDFSSSNNNNDDIDMQSIVSSNIHDRMDDDDDI